MVLQATENGLRQKYIWLGLPYFKITTYVPILKKNPDFHLKVWFSGFP
jgi:hypothetical protein